MRIGFVLPPSRLPTVIAQPGSWWSAIASQSACYDVNSQWWSQLIAADATPDVAASPAYTADPLAALTSPATYKARTAFLGACEALESRINAVNCAQDEFDVSLLSGPTVRRLDYSDPTELVDFASQESSLSRTIDRALAPYPTPDLALFRVTSPQDLLTAMICARRMRANRPDAHLCLLDHGYENFSLHTVIEALDAGGAFALVFDTMVQTRLDIASAIDALLGPNGLDRRGVLSAETLPHKPPQTHRAPLTPIRAKTFTPEPVVSLRLSEKPCYWGRCVYCVQNEKFLTARGPAKSEIAASLTTIAGLRREGVRRFIFSDEALSPAALKIVAQGLCEQKLDVGWAARAKVETGFDEELIGLLAQSGCYEILFGLESVSPHTLQRMDKFNKAIDETFLAEMLRRFDTHGVGVHINLIAGFPGETLAEFDRTLDFTAEALSKLRNATFIVNRFQLFPGTPMAAQPAEFGITQVNAAGDLTSTLNFRLTPPYETIAAEIEAAYGERVARLYRHLGWEGVNETAVTLYFGTGVGAIFKSAQLNPLDPASSQRERRLA